MSESTFKVTIPGDPQAWQRPRFAARSRRVFSPASLEQWYDRAALAIWPLWSMTAPLSGPLRVEVDVMTARPARLPAALKSLGWSALRWREAQRRVARPTTPDVDNYAKAALDALQGDPAKRRPVVIHDDRQVVELRARKWYAAPGEQPCVVIEIWEIEP